MPLVIVSGLPSSGKTTRARALEAYLRERAQQEGARITVHRVDDESLNVVRTAYATAMEEKKARGALLSAVERLLNRDTIVIADALNYVKGFRYQLYCVARAVSTPHCVLYCGVPTELARTWNQERGEQEAYTLQVFDELATRYEEPDAMRRWDAPLFTVTHEDTELPLDDIWSALMLRKAPPPNMATAVKKVSDTNTLHELDRSTQAVVDAVLQAQQEGVGTTSVALPMRCVTMTELRRLRRQFIGINKAHTLPEERMTEAFVEYLNTNLS
ncbi:chromatin associated protein KTI12 [Thamnocephalis sphaerospora]|uniref:Chromatin associated protein KTI12 n=1 Tax=Thamnocephalis sphaerospora TaxID=78915 RepID=A0A4V1IW58_9FUNG|nr:chromatin associated protein KTI12 [Thamnocephalis sphaerospora]|eukprot:RKP06409.1 chromatin associated protein KTI12 [Thamnocephalis sphaerospora]